MTWDQFLEAIQPFEKLIRIALIIVGGFVIYAISTQLIKRFVNQIVSGVKKRSNATDTQALALRSPLATVRTVQRTRTIGSVLQNILSITTVVVVTILCINVIDPGLLPSLSLLSAAVGAGLGFGAQRIVGDVLNGMFMVLEDQIGVGDEVDMVLAKGIVERVGVRVTQVRDIHGVLWFVRNGEITHVGSYSQGWNRAILDMAVPYHEDIEQVKAAMLGAAKTMVDDPDWYDKLIEEPNIWGLQSLSAEAVIVRLTVKTRAAQRWAVERELRLRVMQAFKRERVDIPFMNRVVLDGPNGFGVTTDMPPLSPTDPSVPESDRPRGDEH